MIVVVALTLLASAVLYTWMRISVADGIRAPLVRYCAQLHMQPQDWPCRVSHAQALATYLGGSLLIWLALALPGMFLAAAGRRLAALAPAGVAVMCILVAIVLSWVTQTSGQHFFLGVGGPIANTPGGSFWTRHAAGALVLDLVLVSLPALVIVAGRRPTARPRQRHGPRAADAVAGAAICAVGIALIVGIGIRTHLLYGNETSSVPPVDAIVSMAAMAMFGAVLATDRRWWPWVFAPAAVLLSLAPATALFGMPGRMVGLGQFGAALPLAAIGLVASLWWPLALRRRARAAQVSRPTGGAGDEPVRQPLSRRWLALTTASVGILILAALASAYDTLPAQIGSPIPTYFGLRQRALDVRTRTDLRAAIGVMDGYRAQQGTYAGFLGASGGQAGQGLVWVDGLPQDVKVVGIALASHDRAEVVALSGSGAAFCVRSLVTPNGTDLTYGTGQEAATARANCSSTAWTEAATAFPSFAAMCDNVDDQTLFVCRSVQSILRTIVGSPVTK